MYSLVVPIYRNEEFIPKLIQRCSWLQTNLKEPLEVVFVVDGSPDRSFELLKDSLKSATFHFQLARLSKNFGSFAAIRKGLEMATGDYYAVMAADLQEPKELFLKLFETVRSDNFDIVLGTRGLRSDPLFSRLSSNLFWAVYRRLIEPEMPRGGVDVFACNRLFREHLIAFKESHSSLMGLIFWMGFRRKLIAYDRNTREFGKSAWTLSKKIRYMLDSIFSFIDLPIQILVCFGLIGIVLSVGLGGVILMAKFFGTIHVPGYAATAMLILFFASLNSLGLGIIGVYVWRAFENTKARPEAFVIENLRSSQWKDAYTPRLSASQQV